MADEAFEAKFQMVAGGLTGRYRTLVREVLQRLPSGWDESRTFTFEIGRGSPGYGCAFRCDAVEVLHLSDSKGPQSGALGSHSISGAPRQAGRSGGAMGDCP